MIKNFVDLDKGQTFVESEVGVGGIFTIIWWWNLAKENIDEKNSSNWR